MMKIKKRLKTILAILMTLALLAVGSPLMTVSADTSVCSIGTTTYSSLSNAISAASDGDVINVTADTTGSSITITKNITITSENRSTISSASFVIGEHNQDFAESKEVIFGGNLKLRSTGNMFDLKSGTLTFKDNVDVSTTGNYVVDNGNKVNGTDNNAKIVCNVKDNASISAKSAGAEKGVIGIFQNKSGSELNISGGTITQTNRESFALKLPDDGNTTINITGGTLKGKGGVIQIYGNHSNYKGFKINVSGGRLISEEQGVISARINSKGEKDAGYAHIDISGNAYLEGINNTIHSGKFFEVNVSGGTVVAKEANAIFAEGEDAMVSISGDAKVKALSRAIYLKEGTIVNISGGTIEVSGASAQCGILNNGGMLTVKGGTFVLDGNEASSKMIQHAEEGNPSTEIKGGLFINKCTVNTDIFDENVEYVAGRVLYKGNVEDIQSDKLEASKTVQAIYDNETYYVYTRFAGADGTAMSDEISIRFADGSTGLRFVAGFSQSKVAELAESGTVAYGTIIVPVEYLTVLDSFSIEALTEKYGADGFLNIACTEGSGLIKNDDGSVQLQAAIVNIKTENYDTEFAAVAYACVGGEYYYTAFDQNTNAATIKDVATAALADTAAGYTDAQIAVLNGFAA